MNGTVPCRFCAAFKPGICRICLGRGFMVLPDYAPDSFEAAARDVERSGNLAHNLFFAALTVIVAIALALLCSGCDLHDYLNKKFHGPPERSIPER